MFSMYSDFEFEILKENKKIIKYSISRYKHNVFAKLKYVIDNIYYMILQNNDNISFYEIKNFH